VALVGVLALLAPWGLVGVPVLGLGVSRAEAAMGCVAGPLTVTTNVDSGAGSLRAAFANLDATAGGTICIDTTLLTTPIGLTSASLSYAGSGPVTIDGNGATVQGNNTFGLIVDPGVGLLTVDGLTLTGGGTSGDPGTGGGIRAASVTVTNSTITGNTAKGSGGGIAAGSVTVTNSTISANTADSSGCCFEAGGGGIYAGDSATVIGSTIRGNSASGASYVAGGGIGVGSPLGDSGSVTVSSSTISGNSSNSGGGLSGGSVTVTSSTISGNSAQGIFGGGGIFGGSVTVTSSTITGNNGRGSAGGGGGIKGSSVTVTSSTITGNNGADIGGGIDAVSLTVTSSTITGNSSSFGGGIVGRSEVRLVSATVVANSAGLGGNALLVAPSTLVSFGSVLAQPQSGGNCAFLTLNPPGVVPPATTSSGFNFVDDTSCGFTAGTDSQNATNTPMLGVLGANGGPTQTLLPQSGSPLIDAIPNASCGDGNTLAGFAVTTDQRGSARPSPVGGACDIGAVEVQNVGPVRADLALSLDAPATARVGQTLRYQLTVTNRGPEVARNVVTIFAPPKGLTIISMSPAGGTRFGLLLWTTSSLAPSQTVRFVATGKITRMREKTLIGFGAAISFTNDPAPQNNVAFAVTRTRRGHLERR
jgi:conserved repeat domain